MSSHSTLTSALESVVSLAEKAVAASEDAMAAARLASIHAHSALAAGRLALELERAKTSQTEEVVEAIASLTEAEDIMDPKSGHSDRDEGARIEDNEGDSSAGPSLCRQCQKKECLQGRFLTHFKESYSGSKVKVVGDNWSEEMKSKVGVVEGFQDGFLLVKWVGKTKAKKYWLIRQKGDVGEFQFQFCCNFEASDQCDSPVSERLPSPSLSSISSISQIPSTSTTSLVSSLPPSNLQSIDDNLVGQFVTHYEKKYKGMTVKYCGVSGVGKNWSEAKRRRVGVIEGFQAGYLLLKWAGEEKVKKFLLSNSNAAGVEYQFKFCENENPDSNLQVASPTQDVRSEAASVVSTCPYCRQFSISCY